MWQHDTITHYNIIMVKPCFISKHILGMNLKLNQYSILLSMFSLGMGLSSYNNDVGLCVFLFVKTRVFSPCFISLCNSHNCQDLSLWYNRITIRLVI